MARMLGDLDAYITISPDTRRFGTMTDVEVRKALAAINPKIRIGADTKSAQKAVAELKGRVGALSEQLSNMRADAKTKGAETAVARVHAQVLRLAKQMADLTMAADVKKLDAQIAAKLAQVKGLKLQLGSLQADADTKAAAAKIAALQKQAFHLQEDLTSGKLKARVDIRDAETKIKSINAQLRVLGSNARAVKLAADNKNLLAAISVAQADLAGLRAQARDIKLGVNIDPAKLVAAEAALLGLEHATENLNKVKPGPAFNIITGGGWNVAILGIKGWHLALDGALEAIIAVTGAAIAMTAGITAMGESARNIATHLKAVQTTSSALGVTVPPLTGKLDDLMKAMAPRTIEAFGGAMGIVRSQAGGMLSRMEPVVNLFDTWVAKIDLWVAHQHQFGTAITSGMGFLEQFGKIIGELGMAISNLLTKDPGIAHFLLDFLQGVSGLLLVFSRLPAPIVTTALALHGVYLWTKVLAAAPILAFAKSLGILSDAQARAAKSALSFRNILKFLITNPFGWTIVAAAGLALLGYQLAQADTRTKNFIAGLEQGLQQLSGGAAITQISADVGQLNKQISQVPVRIGNTLLSVTDFAGKAGHSFNQVSYDLNKGNIPGALTDIGRTAYNAVRAFTGWAHIGPQLRQTENDTAAYRDEIVKLTAEQSRLFATTGGLVHQGFSVSQSFALITLAGVKAGDAADVMWQKVQNLIGGYQALAIRGGILANSVNAITFASLQQQERVAQLNDAWDTFFKTVTGGETGFLDFAKQTIGLYRVMAASGLKMGESNGKVSTSMSGLAKASQGATVSMTGLNDVSINARQTFLQSAQAANQQVDNLTLLANAAGLGQRGTNLLAQATKDMVSSLLPATQHSQALTDVLYALAQRGGYRGANSFKALSAWVGKTQDPMKNLDNITTTLTTHASNLTDDVRNLSVALGQNLNDAMAAAILQANGGQQVFDDFATALHKGFTNSQDQQTAALHLGDQLLALTGNAKDAHNEFNAFAQQMHISRDQADKLWNEIASNLTPALFNQAAKVLPNLQKSFASWADHGLNYSRGRANDLWAQIVGKLHPQLDALGNLADGPAKNKFISWAEHGLHLSQTKATALWKELVTLQGHINNLHGKTFAIVMQAHGYVTVSDGKQTFNISQGAWNSPHAAGGRIPGFAPGVDNYPAMLSGGEYVFTPEAASAIGYDRLDQINQAHSRKRLGGARGFASGGLAGMPDSWPGQAAAGIGSQAKADTHKGLASALTAAVKAAMKMALTAFGSGSAIVSYARSFLGKIPYVFGGNSLSGGIDCSGFTQQIYSKFGIHAPRTSEAQYAWAKRTGPVPGGLAFYVSPAGGPPPGHVAIVQNGNSVISQGGGMGPTIESLHFLPLMGTGIPAGGFPGSGGGKGNQAIGGGSLQAIAMALLKQYGWGGQWGAFNALENREAGWRMDARNPSSGAYGLAQFINGPSEYFQYGGNPNTALGQLTAMMNYIAQRYGSPNAAWAHEVSAGWYKHGGPVQKLARGGLVGIYDQGGILPPGGMAVNMTSQPEQVLPPSGMAAGGRIPLARYLPQLKTAQSNEARDYGGLRKAYLTDLAHARTGSWTSGHRAGIKSELATLARRQAAEVAAYKAIIAHGTAAANLKAMTSRVRAVATTSRDKDLAHSHPGWTHGLRYWLSVLSRLSQANVAPVYGGTQAKLQFPDWLGRLRRTQAHEAYDYRGLQAAFKAGLAHARHDTWLYKNRKAIGERLYAVAIRQKAEAAAYTDIIRHSSGSVSDLGGLSGRIARLGNTVNAERSNLQPALLGHRPGGHPGWLRALQIELSHLASLASRPPYSPPWNPGNLGRSHTVPGGVLRFKDGGRVFDSGGVLEPGPNLTWNNTGRRERLVPADRGAVTTVRVELDITGGDQELVALLRRIVRVRGGGVVQRALGQPGVS